MIFQGPVIVTRRRRVSISEDGEICKTFAEFILNILYEYFFDFSVDILDSSHIKVSAVHENLHVFSIYLSCYNHSK